MHILVVCNIDMPFLSINLYYHRSHTCVVINLSYPLLYFHLIVSVKFEQTHYTVTEGSDSVLLSVVLNKKLKSGLTFIVEIVTRDGSATGDYHNYVTMH